MSGGAWNYQSHRITEKADTMRGELATLLDAAASSERIVDWAESCDTSRAEAERELYDLWVGVFNHLYSGERAG